VTHDCTRHDPGSDPCYTRHGCRCDPCRTIHGREVKRRKLLRDSGRPSRIDSTPVVAHLRALLDSGMGRAEITRRARLHGTNLARLLTRQQLTVAPAVAARVYAVRPAPITTQPVGEVPATGTRRRIQALMAVGWHQGAIAREAGLAPCVIGRILDHAPRCFAQTRAKVADAYDRLWDQTPPPTRSHLDSRARNTAARNGWPAPMAWDDDTIDNPDAQPQKLRDRRRAPDELAAEVARLVGTDTRDSIARRLGYRNRHSLARVLHDAGQRDLARRFERGQEAA
jgi:hypothetical protein